MTPEPLKRLPGFYFDKPELGLGKPEESYGKAIEVAFPNIIANSLMLQKTAAPLGSATQPPSPHRSRRKLPCTFAQASPTV